MTTADRERPPSSTTSPNHALGPNDFRSWPSASTLARPLTIRIARETAALPAAAAVASQLVGLVEGR